MTDASVEGRSLLCDHTLVIPTYNRAALLRRLVTYYRRHAPELRLLVLDSSRPEIADENRRMVAAVSGSGRHVAFPNTVPMVAKIHDGLKQVVTPTVSLCADDDLVFPAGLEEAIDTLGRSQGYVCAHGLYINFGEHGHRLLVTREYAGPSNEASHPGARVFRLCQNYESMFYGVFRSRDLQQIFEGAAELPSLHFQELFQSCAALLKGKVKRFPNFYAARRSGPAAEPDRDKWQTYYWFADNPAEISAHYRDYRARLRNFAEQYGEASNLGEAEFARVMDVCHAVYFSKGCPPAYFHSVLQPLWPDDAYVKQQDDLFRLISPLGGDRRLAWAERLARRVLRKLRRMQRPRPTGTVGHEAAIVDLDRAIAAASKAAWTIELPVGLKWLAANDAFRDAYGQLCHYLDSAPP